MSQALHGPSPRGGTPCSAPQSIPAFSDSCSPGSCYIVLAAVPLTHQTADVMCPLYRKQVEAQEALLHCTRGARRRNNCREGQWPGLAGARCRGQQEVFCTSLQPGLVGVRGPGCEFLSGNSRTKLCSILVGAMGFGKSDSISLLSGEWNFVVTP